MFGSAEQCSKYNVKVEVREESGGSLVNSGIPCSIDGNKAQMRYDGLAVNKVRFAKLMNEESEFKLYVTIFKKNEK